MAATKYSASMDDALLADIRSEAEAEGVTLSRWLAEAAADRLHLKALREVMADWEAEHGAISSEELDAVEQKLRAARQNARQRVADADREQAS